MSGFRIKDSIFVGLVKILPLGILSYIGFQIMQVFVRFVNGKDLDLFDIISRIISVNAHITRAIIMILVLSFPYMYGRFSLSTFTSEEKRQKAESLVVFFKGGHKRIVFEKHGVGLNQWVPGIVTGKSSFNDQPMISVVPVQVGIPTAVLLERKDTMLTDASFKDCLRYTFSFGALAPSNWNPRPWTEEDYKDIPHSDPSKNE